MNNPEVSVIIATYRRPEMLSACLRSLLPCRGVRFEVIVVDDGAGLSDAAKAAAQGLDVQWLSLSENVGQPGAQARGVLLASAALLAFLDDDAEVDAYWVASVRDYFAAHRDVSAVLGRIEPLSTRKLLMRTRQQIYDRRHRNYTDPAYAARLKEKYGLRVESETGLSNHISGGNFAIRRGVLEEIGGFSPDVRLGSDALLSERLLESGNAIGYNPRMTIFHHHNPSYRTLFRNNFQEGRDSIRILYKTGRIPPYLGWRLFLNLLKSPFRIAEFPEMLQADRWRIRAYFVYTGIQTVDALGQIFQYTQGLTAHKKDHAGTAGRKMV
jgi:GT2 family glycosyltransferase